MNPARQRLVSALVVLLVLLFFVTPVLNVWWPEEKAWFYLSLVAFFATGAGILIALRGQPRR